jgi:cytochrome P450
MDVIVEICKNGRNESLRYQGERMPHQDFSFSDPTFWRGSDIDRTFAELRRTQPLAWHAEPVTAWNPAGGPGFWSAVSHGLVTEVSRRPEDFGSRVGTEIIDAEPHVVANAGMLNMDAPEHTVLRSIVARVFTPRRVAAMKEHLERSADEIVAGLLRDGEFDFVKRVAETYPAGVIADVMGVDPADLPHLVELTTQILSPPPERSMRANLEMIEYGAQLVRARRKDPAGDLLSHIVQAEADGRRLTDHEAGVFFALLLTAGIETTGTALNHAVVALHENPRQRALWLEDFDGKAAIAVEEVFRWASPVRRFRRTALHDTELAGQRIAAGEKVVMWYSSANRDESVFVDADSFDITRNPNPHVAFGGGGPHFCLGANLARAEARTFLRAFLTAMPEYTVTGPVQSAANDAFNAVVSLPCRAGR